MYVCLISTAQLISDSAHGNTFDAGRRSTTNHRWNTYPNPNPAQTTTMPPTATNPPSTTSRRHIVIVETHRSGGCPDMFTLTHHLKLRTNDTALERLQTKTVNAVRSKWGVLDSGGGHRERAHTARTRAMRMQWMGIVHWTAFGWWRCARLFCAGPLFEFVCVCGGRYILRYLTHDTRLCVTVLVARSGTPKTPVALKSSAAQTHTHTWCSFWRQAAAKMVNNILGLKTSKPEAIVFACVCVRGTNRRKTAKHRFAFLWHTVMHNETTITKQTCVAKVYL